MSSNQGQDLEKHLQATKIFFHAGSFKINFDPLAGNSVDSIIIRIFESGSKSFFTRDHWFGDDVSQTDHFLFYMHGDHVLKAACWNWVKFNLWAREWTQVQIADCRHQITRLRQSNDYVFSFANFLICWRFLCISAEN